MKSIGEQNESCLHAQIKELYFEDGDKMEEPVDDYIIDIVKKDLLIEVQTQNLGAMRDKLKGLLKNHKVRVIHPIAAEKQIIYEDLDESGCKVYSTRKSPKKGTILDVFDELVYIVNILPNPNFEIEVLLINLEELRRRDGKGSRRRHGVSIVDRKFTDILDRRTFATKEDYLEILPSNLPKNFTTKHLSKELDIKMNTSQKIIYCLKKTNLIKQTGKIGNLLVYERC